MAVVQEAYANGVSTRRSIASSSSSASPACRRTRSRAHARAWDYQVAAFRERPLEGRHPYLWRDAKVERVRERGGVQAGTPDI